MLIGLHARTRLVFVCRRHRRHINEREVVTILYDYGDNNRRCRTLRDEPYPV